MQPLAQERNKHKIYGINKEEKWAKIRNKEMDELKEAMNWKPI